MTKTMGMVLMLVALPGFAIAGLPAGAPEISPASGASALTLLAGALLVIRARRTR